MSLYNLESLKLRFLKKLDGIFFLINFLLSDLQKKMPGEGAPQPSSATANPPEQNIVDALFDPWCDPKNPRQVQFQVISNQLVKINLF